MTDPRLAPDRIADFRRRLARSIGAIALLFGITLLVGAGAPWFIIPSLAIVAGLISRMRALWAKGISPRQLLFGVRPAKLPRVGKATIVAPQPGDEVSREILHGPHGATIRRALASRDTVLDILSRMSKPERALLPADLESTIQALADRVTSVGSTLHRLDMDASEAALRDLETRLAAMKKEALTAELERRTALLERQQATLRDLLSRRPPLLARLESASLALETLKLDLVRFTSAGVPSALDDVTSVTREARAISRDIGNLLDAVDEMKRL